MLAHLCHLVQGKLHGIITCDQGKMEGLKTEAVAWSADVKKLIALCHDLVPLSKGKVIGRLDEQKAFAYVEAAFLVCVCLISGTCACAIPSRSAGQYCVVSWFVLTCRLSIATGLF